MLRLQILTFLSNTFNLLITETNMYYLIVFFDHGQKSNAIYCTNNCGQHYVQAEHNSKYKDFHRELFLSESCNVLKKEQECFIGFKTTRRPR